MPFGISQPSNEKQTRVRRDSSAGWRFQNIAQQFAGLKRARWRMIRTDAASASGPACSRKASPGVQRQRNASRHEA